MAAWVEATTREMGQSLINPDKPSDSASELPGDTGKPALGPKPHLMPKPFALQRNATVRPIRAPKTNFSRELHRAASSEALLDIKKPAVGDPNPSESIKSGSNSTVNGSNQIAASKTIPPGPKPDLLTKSKPEPTKSPSSNNQTGPNSKPAVTAEDVKDVQPRSRAKSLGAQDQKILSQKAQEEAAKTEADVKVSSRCWPPRNRLSVELTSKFESPSQPEKEVKRDAETSKTEREWPPHSSSEFMPSKLTVDAGEIREEDVSGGSIKRRISLLFDRSTAAQRRDNFNKRDNPAAEISVDIKQRIQNLSLDAPRTRLPSTGGPKSPPSEKTLSGLDETPNERSSEKPAATEKVSADKSPRTTEIKKSAASVKSAEEEEDHEDEEEDYVPVPVYRRVGMSLDVETKRREEEEKQRKDEQLEKERQQREREKLLEEERKARELERQKEEERKRAEEERKQEEEKQRHMEERRKQEEDQKRRIEEERKEEERRRQAEKERERQIEEEKRRIEEEKERLREEERLKKEKEMEEERRRIQELERQIEEERLRQERERQERLNKEREMEERKRIEEERLKKEERLRQERQERLKKEREIEERKRMEEERLKEEERLRQEQEKERLKKEKEMEEERRRIQEIERQKEEERLRKERELERIRKEKEMEEERRRIQELVRQKEEERLRQEREKEERLNKQREMEERKRMEEERLKEEERLRQEREIERLQKEKEMEEERQRIQEIERQKEEERLRKERELERIRKEKEMEEERRRVQEIERQKEEERLRKERELERIRKEKEMEEERQRIQRQKEEERLRQEREVEERKRMEKERKKEEERLRQEKERERLKKEKEMEDERRRTEELERKKEEERLKKEKEMEEERRRLKEEKWRQEQEHEMEMETCAAAERLREEVPTSYDLISFDAEEPEASQTLISTVSPRLTQVTYDDFSVKPRRWGTRARRSSTPSPSRETPAAPDHSLQPEPREPSGDQVSVQDLIAFEPEASSPHNSPDRRTHTYLFESQPGDLMEPEIEEGQLKDGEPEGDGAAEQDTENLIGEADEQTENNDTVDDLATQTRINQALQRLTQTRQRNKSTDSDPADVPDEEEPEPLPVLQSAAPLLDSSVFRSKVDLGKKRSIKRTRPSRAVRQRAALPALTEGDWRFCDSTDAKDQCSNGAGSESEEEPSQDVTSSPAPSQPKRVPVFPGMDPSVLMAQLKRRSGVIETESPTEAQTPPSVPSRSPRTPTMALGPRVLPPVDAKDSGSGSSPSWLLELKSKKRMSQPESEA